MRGPKVIAGLLLATLWIGGAATIEARPMQQVLNHGTLRIGVAIATPWVLRRDDGLAGFEIDVANKLAADMGVRAEIVVYAFPELVPALEAGEIDIVAAGLTITPERALHVNFSDSYAGAGISLATHSAQTADVTRFEDLDDSAYRVGAVEDSVAAELARRLLPSAKLQLFASIDSASQALVDGTVDAYLEDEPVPTFLALRNPGRIDVPIARPLLQTYSGFAVGKGDPDFLAFLNAWITARNADTWLPTTHRYWFETLDWQE
jgi:polar amino acid transport system substrate-binding protein